MTAEAESTIRSDVKYLFEIAAAVAGSGVALSALMFYFGWVRTRVLFDFFGVPVSILNYSNTDYVLRSAEVFFKPAVWTVLTLGVLTAISIGVHLVESHDSARSWRPLVRGMIVLAALGCVIAGILGLTRRMQPQLSAVLLCVGGVLIVLLYLLYRTHSPTRPPVMVLIIGVLLALAAAFWAVSIYAANLGTAVAADIATGRLTRPNVVVYSTTDLGISGGQAVRCQPDGKACRYTYAGYRLLAYTNNRWILIRHPWAAGTPTVILPDNDSVRVELTP
ncbi:hypothetical protein VST63_02780 [Mycolicibacterium sp. 050232]|uniref:hypothetical protein n=1 Tax=Mycolicibacterium sp. 050232 TaxID=3113982 RepID=UPI002E2A2518|nr:hypothetical protein [Mycolicibacterium sp. 050232]MED5811275.1 hypothetical protein [Mycolicibacterium sp. 050232]